MKGEEWSLRAASATSFLAVPDLEVLDFWTSGSLRDHTFLIELSPLSIKVGPCSGGYPMGLHQESMDDLPVDSSFPATTKQTAGDVDGVKTDVMLMSFADKIMITVTQNGRLAQWVCLSSIDLTSI